MTIVASNSLTVSNVNDGTITHYAYANSADGKDGFYVGGGTNLLINSNFSSGLNHWTINPGSNKDCKAVVTTDSDGDTCIHITGTGVACGIYSAPVPFNQNQITTGSVFAKGTAKIYLVGLENRPTSNFGTVSTESYSKVGSTTQASSNTNSFVVYFSAVNDVVDVYIKFVKLEQGNKDTPWSPAPSEAHPSYIGQYTDFNTTASTDPTKYAPWIIFKGIDGKDGIAGKDGVGIKTTVITYAISTNGTTAPATGWTSSVPSLIKGQYLWTKTVWTYTDNSSETGYSVTYISKDGNNGNDGIAGKDGVGIKTTTITYASHTNGITAPTTGYTTTVPSVPAGQFLWTKTVWTYTDNTSETGYSVGKMGNTGPAGPAGSNGNPGKVVSDTEPTTKFKGLAWKYSGVVDMTLGDGTKILAGTEYYWNGTVWTLYEINAHNINGDNLSVTNGTFKDGKIESVWGNNDVNGTTTIEGSHLQIYSSNSTTNTENTVEIDNLQGYAQVYTDRNTGRAITVQASVQGFFVSDSTGPYVRVTPNGIENSVDVSWTTIGSYAAYRRDGRVVTIRVVGAKRSTTGDIYIGSIPLKDCPAASVMAAALAWSASVANDKHIQINGLNQSNSGAVTILSAAANQEYTFQCTYQI
ncbi:MAG: hypothetical protein WAX06_07195 [Lactococcus lactis]